MEDQFKKEPIQAWITTFAVVAINMCLGILYAWKHVVCRFGEYRKSWPTYDRVSMKDGYI